MILLCNMFYCCVLCTHYTASYKADTNLNRIFDTILLSSMATIPIITLAEPKEKLLPLRFENRTIKVSKWH